MPRFPASDGASLAYRTVGDWPLLVCLPDGRLRTTAVTAFELRLRADFTRRSSQIAALLQRADDLARRASRRWPPATQPWTGANGDGQSLSATPLVTSVRLSRELPLATRNLRHFSQVEGLQLQPLDTD